ncbi:N-acetylmuramic acid 6-phosphate etherase, partial [Mesorhizobium sp. M4A.F.Ca.ET.020.02.1.1]
AVRIVAAISGRGREDAARQREKSGGVVKTAILLAAGAANADTAEKILEETGQKLRPALSAIEGSKGR